MALEPLFEMPEQVEESFLSLWKRYSPHSYEDESTYPAVLHCLNGWCFLFQSLVTVLEDLPGKSATVEQIESKLYGIHGTFGIMGEDLHQILVFTETTLPHDPVLQKWVDQAKARHPELFNTGAPSTDV